MAEGVMAQGIDWRVDCCHDNGCRCADGSGDDYRGDGFRVMTINRSDG